MDYEHFLTSLLVDLVAISLLTYGLYYRRHHRRDLTLGLMGVNVGLFAVSSFTATSTMSVGFGIGLFALLSVIRLRSTTASQEEIGYYFVALVIGLVNGLSTSNGWGVTLTLNVVLLGVMFVADHPRMLRHSERHRVVLRGKPRPLDLLQGEVEDRLGYEVTKLRVLELDYAQRRTIIDVRINTGRPVEKRRSKVEPPAGGTEEQVEPPADEPHETVEPPAGEPEEKVEPPADEPHEEVTP
jgi:hypothetical protein